VVSTTSQNPCTSTNLKRGLWNPESAGNRQIRHGLWLDALNLLRNQTEAVAKIYDSSLDATTHLRGEYQTSRLLLADADAEEVNFQLGFVDSNQRTNLEHVALQT